MQVFYKPVGFYAWGVNTEQLGRLSRAYSLAQGELGRQLRERGGVSLRQMGEAIQVGPGELSRWERGLHRPRTRAALRWLAAIEAIEAGIAASLAKDDPANTAPGESE